MSEKVGVAVKKPESKGQDSALAKTKAGFSPSVDINSPVGQMLYLQRSIGNRAVSRMVRSGVIRTKLTIGQPGDIYEQEADRVADHVMRMTEPQGALVNGHLSLVQRKSGCPGCKEEEKPISRKESGSCGGSDVMSCVESHINASKGGGQSLSPSTRSFFEPRFGSDFSNVRVHTGSDAAAIATEINAKAFTTGRAIFFNTGQYSPGTTSGKNLLAHELTHVVQQGKLSPKFFESNLIQSIYKQRSDMLHRQPLEEDTPPVIPQGTAATSISGIIQRATTADGVDVGPTNNGNTFCMDGIFLGGYMVGQNTASAATGKSVIKFKGLNAGKEGNKNCSCDCGFLRQYIKGYWKWGKGGAKQYSIQSCGNSLTINESTWTEEYMSCDPQANKCKQEYTDSPGWNGGLADGNYIELKYNFKFELWDHCQGKPKSTAFKTLFISGDKAPRRIRWT